VNLKMKEESKGLNSWKDAYQVIPSKYVDLGNICAVLSTKVIYLIAGRI
jgi:hypothetical protein